MGWGRRTRGTRTPRCTRVGEAAREGIGGARYLADGLGFKPATISQALAAIAEAHELAGVSTPTADPAVREVVREFRRQKGRAPQKARPLAPPDLRVMSRALPKRLIGTRDRALILLGFASALRRS